jgi:hypothetical protein
MITQREFAFEAQRAGARMVNDAPVLGRSGPRAIYHPASGGGVHRMQLSL